MRYILIVFAFLIETSHQEEPQDTFIASFQSSGKWTPDEYLEYTGNIPDLKEFTSCHWEKAKFFSEKMSAIWTYCQHFTDHDKILRCIQIYFKFPNLDGSVRMELYTNEWINKTMWYYIIHENIPYQHQRWNHFCLIYSISKEVSWLYHNGQLISNLTISDETVYGYKFTSVIPSSSEAYDSSFIVGQEPDSMRGTFNEKQAYSGDIFGLNIWDRILSSRDIESMYSCARLPKGNIIEWNVSKWKKNKVRISENTTPIQSCESEITYLLFPEKLTYHDALMKCKVHGGKTPTPNTMKENIAIVSTFQQKDSQFVKGIKSVEPSKAWLGLENRHGLWYESEQMFYSNSPINYSNWRDFYSTNVHQHEKLCPYVYNDGSWAYGRGGACEYLTNSVVCSFTDVPTFLLKGRFRKSAKIERLYYIASNASNEFKGFSGISNKSRIAMDDESVWSLETKEVGNTKLLLDRSMQPVGRNKWAYSNEKEEDYESFCLSNCKLGEEFTCNSGECISMLKRCDRNFDCEDNSDELLCKGLEIPLSYSKNNAPSVSSSGNRITRLIVQCIVEKVNFIDTINTKIGLVLTLTMFWNDSRLTFKNLHHKGKATIRNQMSEQIWLPLHNSVHVYAVLGKILTDGNQLVEMHGENKLPFDIETSIEDYYYSGSNNSLSMIQRFQVEYDCHFDLQNYPFDEQICRFGLDVKGKDDEKFLLIHNSSESIAYIGPKDVGDFEIIEVTDDILICEKDVKNANNSLSIPELLLCIRIKRSHADQVVSIFCPSILFWLLAYFTLFLDINDVSNRSRTSVTLLLVYIALLQTVKREFPKTTYYKFIDIWFLWYVSNTFLISLYHIILP